MKTLLIEDGTEPLTSLRNKINTYGAPLELIAEGYTLEEGLALLHQHKPDLVFLDVCLEDGMTFGLWQGFPEIHFHLVFVTAYEAFTRQAFRDNAIHYLLKPVGADAFYNVVKRIQQIPKPNQRQLNEWAYRFGLQARMDRIAVRSASKIVYLALDEISRMESDGAYTHVYLTSGEHMLSTQPLKVYDALLAGQGFCRIHRSHLVPVSQVREYDKNRECVVLKNGSRISVSRKKRADFLQAIAISGGRFIRMR